MQVNVLKLSAETNKITKNNIYVNRNNRPDIIILIVSDTIMVYDKLCYITYRFIILFYWNLFIMEWWPTNHKRVLRR